MASLPGVKPRAILNRHVLSLCTLLFLSLILLHTHPQNNLVRDTNDFEVHSLLGTTPSNTSNSKPHPKRNLWATPPPLQRLLPLTRGSPLGNKLASHVWTHPKVLTSFARPLDSDPSWTELFLYATGVRMGSYNRTITPVGCVVGDDVYDGFHAMGEVYVCDVPKRVRIGERVSLVLRRDDALRRAMAGQTLRGLDVTIAEDDVADLPAATRMHLRDGGEWREFVKIRSDEAISHIAPSLGTIKKRARYKVCMGTQMKTFPELVGPWVSYHRKLGVDMIYILDNDSPADVGQLVRGVRGVEVVYWPFQKSQTQAMSYLLVALRERCEWVLLSDADEYVMIGLDADGGVGGMREYVDGIDASVAQAYLPYLTMGGSGHTATPAGPVAEEYVYKSERQKVNGKALARGDFAWVSSRIHVNKGREGSRMERTAVANDKPRVGDAAVLVHFQKRSFEEMMVKQQFGSGSVSDGQQGARSGFREGLERLAAGTVPKYYTKVRPELRYTYFRDVWRKVERKKAEQVLVAGPRGERVRLIL